MPHVRCCKCGARRTLPRHPDEYLRQPPRCRGGGCRSRKYRVDRYRQTRERGPASPRPCRCGEYIGRDGCNMPHRLGSGWCAHNIKITDEDRQERWENGSKKRAWW